MRKDFDYKTATLVEALRQYPKDIPDLGYNGKYLMREAAVEIERLNARLKVNAAWEKEELMHNLAQCNHKIERLNAENDRYRLENGKLRAHRNIIKSWCDVDGKEYVLTAPIITLLSSVEQINEGSK